MRGRPGVLFSERGCAVSAWLSQHRTDALYTWAGECMSERPSRKTGLQKRTQDKFYPLRVDGGINLTTDKPQKPVYSTTFHICSPFK